MNIQCSVHIAGFICYMIGIYFIRCTGSIQDKSEQWTLCTDRPPTDNRMWPSLGNGHLGMAAQSDTVYMNGLYNGKGTNSTRARIPAFISVVLGKIPLHYNSSYCLHIDKGVFVVTYRNDHWTIEMKVYAHRKESRLLVTQITCVTDGHNPTIRLPLYVNHGKPSAGIRFTNGVSDIPNTRYTYGRTREAETPDSGTTPVHVYYSIIPDTLTLQAGQVVNETTVFLMSVSPYKQEANTYFKRGLALVSQNILESSHVATWQKLWDAGSVDIYGNPRLDLLTHSSLYYIYSAMPIIEENTWPFIGLSPSDLAHNGYNGHVFWDQDTWMYPPILMLHNDLGRTLLKTRLRTLDSALQYARLTGYRGARYPWETALTGFDVTPSEDCNIFEVHINGDIGVAFEQYLMMSDDVLTQMGGTLQRMIFALADYWISRSTYNSSRDQYEILNVMPPDEWNYPVNNSVYTNYIAQKVLKLPGYLCRRIGCKVPDVYDTVANKMYIPYDTELHYHPEYEGYNNVSVKQADVILLGWPLQMKMSKTVRKNDLEIYAKVTPAGPAMSWGMYTVGWLDVGEYDKATLTFNRQQLNNKHPFNMWTENADGSGATNFITGMGGYLQSIMFGYAGIRMQEDGLVVNCQMIPGTTGFRLRNMDYYGNSIDIACYEYNTTLTIVSGRTMMYVILASNRTVLLHVRSPLSVHRQRLTITHVTKADIYFDIIARYQHLVILQTSNTTYLNISLQIHLMLTCIIVQIIV